MFLFIVNFQLSLQKYNYYLGFSEGLFVKYIAFLVSGGPAVISQLYRVFSPPKIRLKLRKQVKF